MRYGRHGRIYAEVGMWGSIELDFDAGGVTRFYGRSRKTYGKVLSTTSITFFSFFSALGLLAYSGWGAASAYLGHATCPVPSLQSLGVVGTAFANTDCGRVEGLQLGSVNVFRGIKYAVAEVWQLPRGLSAAGQCWAPATLTAKDVGPVCWDNLGMGKSAMECLTLSVWVPRKLGSHVSNLHGWKSAKGDAKLPIVADAQVPVMVYFHGGGLTHGCEGGCFGKSCQNFELLAAHGDGVVVVDVNYRQNLAGFLSVEAMASESSANSSGMFGIHDMIESLRWVQRNIASFGGDPSRVTIFGQSSGGTAVLVLLASPLASGLFTSAMSLSGSPNISMSAAHQRLQHELIAQHAGCGRYIGVAKDVMKCLRESGLSFPFGGVWWAEPKGGDHEKGTQDSPSWSMDDVFDIPRYGDGRRMPGLAVVDGDVLREPVLDAYIRPRNDVPVIVSSMGQEISDGPGHTGAGDVSKLTPDELTAHMNSIFQYKGDSFGSLVAQQYTSEIAVSRQLAFDTIATDISMTCGTLALALAAGKGFSRSSVYLVHNEAHLDDHFASAYHTGDLDMVNQGSGSISVALRDSWHEFASTGRVKAWQTVNANSSVPWLTTRITNNGTLTSPSYKLEQCRFWREAGFGPEFWWSN